MSEKLTNQELNVWLAENLFGFQWRRSSVSGSRGLFPPDAVVEWYDESADGSENISIGHPSYVPDYSGNISDAWKVIDQLRTKRWLAVVKDMPDGFPYLDDNDNTRANKIFRRSCAQFQWMPRADIEDTRKFIHSHTFSIADTPARAICEAAKKAVEADRKYSEKGDT